MFPRYLSVSCDYGFIDTQDIHSSFCFLCTTLYFQYFVISISIKTVASETNLFSVKIDIGWYDTEAATCRLQVYYK